MVNFNITPAILKATIKESTTASKKKKTDNIGEEIVKAVLEIVSCRLLLDAAEIKVSSL